MSSADVDAITAAHERGPIRGEGGVNVGLVPQNEIKANAFDLNIGRYLKTGATNWVYVAPPS